MVNTTIRRAMVRALVALLFAAGLTAVAATPSVAAGCFGVNCNGRNPNTNGCTASSPWSYFSDGGGSIQFTVELRKSGNCGAVWSRVIKEDCYGGSTRWYVSIEHRQYTPYGWVVERDGTASSGTSTCDGGREWSYMRVYRAEDMYRLCYKRLYYDGSPRPGRYDELPTCYDWVSI